MVAVSTVDAIVEVGAVVEVGFFLTTLIVTVFLPRAVKLDNVGFVVVVVVVVAAADVFAVTQLLLRRVM